MQISDDCISLQVSLFVTTVMSWHRPGIENCPTCPQTAEEMEPRIREHQAQEKAFDEAELSTSMGARGMTTNQIAKAINFCTGWGKLQKLGIKHLGICIFSKFSTFFRNFYAIIAIKLFLIRNSISCENAKRCRQMDGWPLSKSN